MLSPRTVCREGCAGFPVFPHSFFPILLSNSEGGRQVLVDRLVPPVEDQAPPHSSLSEPVKVDTAGVSEPVGAVDTKPRKDEKPSNEGTLAHTSRCLCAVCNKKKKLAPRSLFAVNVFR